MTISEYVKYEEKMKRLYLGNPRSYFPTKYDDYSIHHNTSKEFPHYLCDAKIDACFNLPPLLPCFKLVQPHIELEISDRTIEEELSSEEYLDEWLIKELKEHMSKLEVENKEDALILIMKTIVEECKVVYKSRQENAPETTEVQEVSPMAYDDTRDLGACVNIMPNSIFKHLGLTNLKEANMLVEMADMTQQSLSGIVENVLVKIDKFVFSCDFVVIDMPGVLGEMMILGRPFLATIHAQIDVFKGEISLGIVRRKNPLTPLK
ncbi:RNA-directed DNA polymerase, eukaryota, reverse transcriptase zinc-binding domain protein [Tanacetum coccineum]